jgi:glutathione peroxidase-family protein
MDRKYKAENTVLVFRTHAYEEQEPGYEKPIAKFKQKPYSMYGMDYFKYKGVMYPAYHNAQTGIYILLNRPLIAAYPK